jgi:hypothetical protein
MYRFIGFDQGNQPEDGGWRQPSEMLKLNGAV